MPIPTHKDELLVEIAIHYKRLSIVLASITDNDATKLELDGHAKNTTMSVQNLVAYLVGWGELVLKWNRLKKMGEAIDFPETGYKWNQLGALAQKFYKDYEQDDFVVLQKKLKQCTNEILRLVEQTSNEELYVQQDWYKTYSLGRMIQLNTSSPFKNALIRIKKWKKEQLKK